MRALLLGCFGEDRNALISYPLVGLVDVILLGILGQWLNFKLFGITYLVGKISRSNCFFQGPLAK